MDPNGGSQIQKNVEISPNSYRALRRLLQHNLITTKEKVLFRQPSDLLCKLRRSSFRTCHSLVDHSIDGGLCVIRRAARKLLRHQLLHHGSTPHGALLKLRHLLPGTAWIALLHGASRGRAPRSPEENCECQTTNMQQLHQTVNGISCALESELPQTCQ